MSIISALARFQLGSKTFSSLAKDSTHQYPFSYLVNTQWGEVDSFQHVNNTVYFRYFESARIEHMRKILDTLTKMESKFRQQPDSPYFVTPSDYQTAQQFLQGKGVGPILAFTSCKYKFPLGYPDSLVVGVHIPAEKIEKDRFIQLYRIYSKTTAKVAAEGEAKIVCYDYAKKATAPIPKGILQGITAIETSLNVE